MVALVGEANDRGDGRAITLYQANLSLPEEKIQALAGWSVQDSGELALAAWGWTLARDPEARRHWQPRARGVSIDSEQGYRFRGRMAALTEIAGWLDRAMLDRRALVVTGSPGVGKSAVLGRIVTTADAAIRAALPPNDDAVCATPSSVACAVHAKGKTALEVAAEIARAASARLPDDAGDLGPALRDALTERDGQRFNVVIDALDEAATSTQAREIITKVVLPLAESCSDLHAQVIVGTRRRDDGGDLFRFFGGAVAVIDLDDPEYFEEADLAAYAMASLQLVGDERPGNPYANDEIAGPLARRIAQLAGQNFLVAGLIARAHGMHDRQPALPQDLVFSATVDSALATYLERIRPIANVSAEIVLTALAFVEAPGLPIDLWQRVIEVIGGHQITAQQLSRFARSSAANFLVESSTGGAGPVFRLFHQALNEALLRARSQFASRGEDERALSEAFIRLGRQSGWRHVPAYLLRSLAAHAAIAGVIDDLLLDNAYLLHADLRRLIPLTERAVSAPARRRAWMLRLTPEAIVAEPQDRAALFSVTEALDDLGHAYPGTDSVAPYRGVWAAARPRPERASLRGHTGGANMVCTFTLDDQVLLATSGGDWVVRIWDPVSGEQRATLDGHTDWVRSICAFTLDSEVLLATASEDRTVRIWNPRTGEQRATLDGHRGGVHGICAFTLHGRVLLATGGRDRVVRLWNPRTGEQQAVLDGHTDWVRDICAFALHGKVQLATASADGTLRIWDPATSSQRAVLRGHTGMVSGLCAFTLHAQVLLATASDDRTVRIWDPAAGEQRATLHGHTDWVNGLCAFTMNNQVLLATTCGDRTVRIWDPATGEQRAALDGHTDWVRSICALTLRGHVLLVTGGGHRTVRIWDPATGDELAAPNSNIDWIYDVCAFTLGEEILLASAGGDGTLRIWDAATGELRAALKGHTDGIYGVCAFTLGEEILLASAGGDGTLRIWDGATGELRAALEGHTDHLYDVCAFTLHGKVLLAAVGADGILRIWDAATGELRAALEGHTGAVRGVCVFTLGSQVLLATSGDDWTVRIWDPAIGKLYALLEGHTDGVYGICAFTLGSEVLLATASADDTVRIWNAATGSQYSTLDEHTDAVNRICAFTFRSNILLATVSDDRTMRIWDPAAAISLLCVPAHHVAQAVYETNGRLIVGLSAGILTIELGLPSPPVTD
ncbi:WD40 repeat domain-containing protein [Trebonia sp.]|uniref:WD40 repeat domain-containing protein n=1 Tax=Trebonia sp. TaxID=2767075 RepID=UPI00262A838C|nr:WD40 repeat domain-containing protein [Trebonia sp.]